MADRTVRVEAWNDNQVAVTLTVGQVLTIDDEGVVRNEYGSGLCVLRPVVDCPRCHGEGRITFNPAWPDPQGEDDAICPECHGTGIKENE